MGDNEDEERLLVIESERSKLNQRVEELKNLDTLSSSEAKEVFTVTGKLIILEKEADKIMAIRASAALNPVFASSTMVDANDSSVFSKAMEISSSAIAKAMIKIDPCVPTDGNKLISTTNFNRWKNAFAVTAETADLNDKGKLDLFNKSAGDKLLDILEVLPEYVKMQGEKTFDKVIKMLDRYFGSEARRSIARINFKSMKQARDESCLEFVDRMTKAAMGCDYPLDTFDENLMDAIVEGTTDRQLAKKAILTDESSGKRCSHDKIRQYATGIEQIKASEKKRGEKEKKEVFAVEVKNRSSYAPTTQRAYTGNWSNGRNDRDGGQRAYPRSHVSRPARPDIGKECELCGNRDHWSKDCFAKNKNCHECGEMGHLSRMCRSLKRKRENRDRNQWQRPGDGDEKPPVKLRVVNEEDASNTVMHANDDLDSPRED